MGLWFSTHNDGKLQEFKELLQEDPVEVHAASELSFFSAPPETGDTFEANARIKARALRSIKDKAWVEEEYVQEGKGGAQEQGA